MVNVPNYTERGGEKTVIGGELVINGKLTFGDGAVAPVENVAAVDTESPTAEKNAAGINAVIAALIAAGLMESAS